MSIAFGRSVVFPQSGLDQSTLQGDVKDERGDAIVGAKVTLSKGDHHIHSATDDRGHFLFKPLTSCNYLLQVDAEGFGEYQDTIAVGMGSGGG
ncbi:MAG: carboxypeptidase-like regulatory domain-containing protein, partial [Blastocatellia bacterium]